MDALVLQERLRCEDECSYALRRKRYDLARANLGALQDLARVSPRPTIFDRVDYGTGQKVKVEPATSESRATQTEPEPVESKATQTEPVPKPVDEDEGSEESAATETTTGEVEQDLDRNPASKRAGFYPEDVGKGKQFWRVPSTGEEDFYFYIPGNEEPVRERPDTSIRDAVQEVRETNRRKREYDRRADEMNRLQREARRKAERALYIEYRSTLGANTDESIRRAMDEFYDVQN